MAFKDNLLKKIEINRLADQVRASLVPKGEIHQVDKAAMRQLLGHGGFDRVDNRDLELYVPNPPGSGPQVVVLDNGLGLYRTGIDDVVLRKSPTVKEMVSLRNIVRILRDDDVLVCKKADTVAAVQQQALAGLDLRFTEADIDNLRLEGAASLANGYAEGVDEALALFAELLGLTAPPKPLALAHHLIVGKTDRSAGRLRYGPMVLFNRMFNRLLLVEKQADTGNTEEVAAIRQVADTGTGADAQGPEVFARLKQWVVAAEPN